MYLARSLPPPNPLLAWSSSPRDGHPEEPDQGGTGLA